jgi:hypothetical protein
MSLNSQQTNDFDGCIAVNDKKMKFLDDLFEDNLDKSPYSLLNPKSVSINLPIKKIDNLDGDNSESSNTGKPFLSINIFIGILFSFFLLSYTFSFNLMIVVPLSIISLFIYQARSKGSRNYYHYRDSIRKGLKNIIKKIKNNGTEENSSLEKSCMDYKLLK